MNFDLFSSSYYFSIGCAYSLPSFIAHKNKTLPIKFIEINSIKLEFLLVNEEEIFNEDVCYIIICSVNFSPIAYFFEKKYDSILAVYDSRKPIFEIKEFITGYNEYSKQEDSTVNALTTAEYETLKKMINGVTPVDEAKSINRTLKTVYTHRSNVVRKMGLRKICNIYTIT